MDIKGLILILMAGVLVNNYVLQRFLGICPFLGVSKKYDQERTLQCISGFLLIDTDNLGNEVFTVGFDFLDFQALGQHARLARIRQQPPRIHFEKEFTVTSVRNHTNPAENTVSTGGATDFH